MLKVICSETSKSSSKPSIRTDPRSVSEDQISALYHLFGESQVINALEIIEEQVIIHITVAGSGRTYFQKHLLRVTGLEKM
ncbi:unnamed protein product, partial [Nesidiocoris tenuis]